MAEADLKIVRILEQLGRGGRQLEGLRKAAEGDERRIGELEEALGLGQVKIGELEEALSVSESRAGDAEGKLDVAEGKIMEYQISEMESVSRIGDLEEALSASESRAGYAEGKLQEAAGRIVEYQISEMDIIGVLEKLEGCIEVAEVSTEDAVAKAVARVVGLEERIRALEGEVGRLEEEGKELKAREEASRSDFIACEEVLGLMNVALGMLEEERACLVQEVGESIETREKERRELEEKIRGMEETIEGVNRR